MVRFSKLRVVLFAALLCATTLFAQTPAKTEPKPGAQPGKKAAKLPKNLSLLFLVTIPQAELKMAGEYKGKKVGPHLVVPASSDVVVFADRPHRLAKPLAGGVKTFATIYGRTDFKVDPPNVTFAGHHQGTKKEQYTVFTMRQPFVIDGGQCVLPLSKINGSEKMPAAGKYKDLSLVVDNIIGDWFEAAAAVIGTAVACTVGEVVTVGADTAVCAAGVAASAAVIGNASADTAAGSK